jgi:hypothetical protein
VGRPLALATDRCPVHADPLDPVDRGQPERVGDPDRHLVVAGIGGLVAEQQQVELGAVGAHGVDDCRRRRLRVPLAAVGDQVDAAVHADGHHVAQLLLGLGGSEREHHGLPPMRFDQPDRLLGGALLVRAHRKPQVSGLDGLLVLGEGDLAAGERHPLDADEDVHERTRAFSASNTGVASLVATVTG